MSSELFAIHAAFFRLYRETSGKQFSVHLLTIHRSYVMLLLQTFCRICVQRTKLRTNNECFL